MAIISKNITVVGAGYVGMSISVLLAKDNQVTVFDIDKKRVELISKLQSTVADPDIEKFLIEKDLNLSSTSSKSEAYRQADYVIVATPTDFDESMNQFNTSSVDEVVKDVIDANSDVLIIIKSTIPIGHTKFLQEKFSTKNIIFSPEFLREGTALNDNLYPSRIIIGNESSLSNEFAETLSNSVLKKDPDLILMDSTSAECVKLFSNTYLAMRVAFFNELDNFTYSNNLDTKNIIDGMSLDSRIGDYYNNPSFGYGGYCLPKDTRQLLANYDKIPQNLIEAIISSNKTRKSFIVTEVMKRKPKVIGLYRLNMKKNSDNFRSSAISYILDELNQYEVEIIIYEPEICSTKYKKLIVEKDLFRFKNNSDIILANRKSDELVDVQKKVFTRDVYNNN